MNKELLKLLGDAGFHQPELERQGLESKFEKLAELIAVRCANIVWDEADKNNDPAVNDAGYKIIEQFGLNK